MYKYLIAGLLLTSAAVFLFNQESISLQSSQNLYQEYQQWKAKYNKSFSNSNEDVYRFAIFSQNYDFIQQSGNKSLGLNIMADLTNEEFQAKYINNNRQAKQEFAKFQSNPNFKAAGAVNWVEKGAVTPVQDQGSCGSCWAFGSVGALEGLWQVSGNTLTKLSEQQLVDCDKGNYGCSGGLELTAYQYTKQQGIMTEASYPYTSGTTGKRGDCQYNTSDVVYKNASSFQVAENDVPAIVEAVSKQPLSKGISAGSIYFQLYDGGIMDSTGCGNQMNHSVTLVAYSDDAETPYWTIKNSWGTGWGDKGFMHLKKGDNGQDGVCGINMDSTAPTL